MNFESLRKQLRKLSDELSLLKEDKQQQSERVDSDPDNPWREDPLPLAEFVSHPDHLSPDGRLIELYPVQRRVLEEFLGVDPKQLFSEDLTYTRFQQAFILWGKGSGKDLTVSLVQCWIAHILLCLKDPQKYLGLAPDESLDIVVIAYNQTQARSVYFTKFKNRVKSWKWLRRTIDALAPETGAEKWLRESGGKLGADLVQLPNYVNCWSLPSTPESGEGKNLIFWVLDELAAFSSPTRFNQAQKIHEMVVSSARTRFMSRWRGFAISFPRHGEDYMMQMIKLAQRGDITDLYTSVLPTWEVNPRVTRESLETDYKKNPEDARTRYECKPPSATDAYFRSPEQILINASGADRGLLEEYLFDYSSEQIEAIALRGNNPIRECDIHGDPVLDRRGFPKLQRWVRGKPDTEYFVHLDPGLTGDAFGFAMGHIEDTDAGSLLCLDLAFRWVGKHFKDFGEIYRQSWFSDTLNRTETINAAEVDFATVVEFIFFLKVARGFSEITVTCDGWNAASLTQDLRARQVEVFPYLVDKSDYDEYKSLVYNRQLKYYCPRILYRESVKLQIINGTKVDCPRTQEGDRGLAYSDSHKDVSDAVAAVCRRMVVAREGIEFIQLDPIETIWDRADKETNWVAVEANKNEISEAQRKLMAEFFSDNPFFDN
ncbi:MAG: hypothetical protein LRZ84_14750 [Desertifilum sp.]|nr:hypothetical protein [Desertifilum sp.]